MKVRIKGPQRLNGRIKPPGSKAYTHRALVASMLTRGKTELRGALVSEDTVHTLDAIRELGARVSDDRREIQVHGIGIPSSTEKPLDCGESGATLRFLTAVACTSSQKTTFVSRTGLAARPIEPLLRALSKLGASTDLYQSERMLRVTVQGPLNGGMTSINGEISSQFISGLLLASPFARDDVTISIEGKLESRPYVDLTLAILRQHGIHAEDRNGTFVVPAPQEYKPTTHDVPRDFSSTAFLIAAGVTLGGSISLGGFTGDYRIEPDSIITDLLPQMGASADESDGQLTVSKSRLRGFEFDARNNPDLVPVLEVLASQALGRTRITGAERLRYKETDRLTTVPSELNKMGALIKVEKDLIAIDGADHLTAGNLSSHHDHRVAMACATAALAATGESVIEDAGVVSKSYPAFFNDLQTLGAKFYVE